MIFIVLIHATIGFITPIFRKFSNNNNYFMTCITNTRLVCTYLNALLMKIPNNSNAKIILRFVKF